MANKFKILSRFHLNSGKIQLKKAIFLSSVFTSLSLKFYIKKLFCQNGEKINSEIKITKEINKNFYSEIPETIPLEENIIFYISPEKGSPLEKRFSQLFVDLEVFLEHFLKTSENLLKSPLKIYKVPSKNKEEIEKKFNFKFKDESIFAIKNANLPNFYEVSFIDFLYADGNIFINYLKEIASLNKKTINKFFTSLNSIITPETAIFLTYSPKKSENYQNIKESLYKISLDEYFSKNKNIHFFFIDNENVLEDFKFEKKPKEGETFLLMKTSPEIFKNSNVVLNGKKFLIKSSINLLENNEIQDFITKTSKLYNEINVFNNLQCFGVEKEYSLMLEIDRNKKFNKEINEILEIFMQTKQNIQKNDNSKITFNKSFKNVDDYPYFNLYIENRKKITDDIMMHQIKTKEELIESKKNNVIIFFLLRFFF